MGPAPSPGTHGLEPIEDPDAWFTPAGLGELIGPVGSQHGTVGCVALDAKGRLASAASTGGTFGKRPGRVGDTPIVGAGIWADEGVAVACTGLGEYFQRTAAAARVAHRVSFSGLSVSAATQDAMSRIAGLGGTGAIIALGAGGDISLKYLGAGLKCAVAWRTAGSRPTSCRRPWTPTPIAGRRRRRWRTSRRHLGLSRVHGSRTGNYLLMKSVLLASALAATWLTPAYAATPVAPAPPTPDG